eukprot:TRINITY_DN761_c0_g1_i2.p1 TRINITY_DN761_c0_g1~~TRINITY_DN761_c0_g1_i2.p1  ORF type:complete len:301 (-),score=-6.60 TRINITY_DN761_c0_g1_i2:192-1004(-)
MEYTQTPLLPPTQPAAHPIGVPVVAQPSPIVVVPAAEPRDLLQNVTAVYFTEDRNPGFLSSSLAYSVCDYSNTLRGNTLFSGFMIDSITSQFKYFFPVHYLYRTVTMELRCVALGDAWNNATRYLSITKAPLSTGCTISYTYPIQPLLLGEITEECGFCKRELCVVDTVARKVLYWVVLKSSCCNKYDFYVLGADRSLVGRIRVVCQKNIMRQSDDRCGGVKETVVEFPIQAGWVEKSLLLGAAIYVNMVFIEDMKRRRRGYQTNVTYIL